MKLPGTTRVHKPRLKRSQRCARLVSAREQSAREQPRQGIVVDERFGESLPQQPAGIYFLVEVDSDRVGLAPHEVQEPGSEFEVAAGPGVTSSVEIEVQEVLATHDDEDSDVEMYDV